MKKVFIFLCLFSIVACSPKEQEPLPSLDTTIILSNTTPMITEQDVKEHLSFLSEEDAKFANTPVGRKNLLQAITREKLILKDALETKLDTSKDYLQLLKEKKDLLDAIYQDYAKQTLEEMWYQQQVKNETLLVTQQEIDDYYKKYNYEMRVKQIIVNDATTAEQILRTLKSTPSRWKEMEKQYNIAPEYLQKEPFSFIPGEFFQNIEDAIANSSVNSVQGFIKTPLGFHIIMKVGEKYLSKEEAEPRIRSILENRKLDKIIEALKNKYEVVIYDTNK